MPADRRFFGEIATSFRVRFMSALLTKADILSAVGVSALYQSRDIDQSGLIKWSGDIVRGKDNIQKFFEQTFKDNPNLQMQNHLESAHLINADAVMSFGTLKFAGNSKNWPSESKFAVLWQKMNGKWKALFDAGFVTTTTGH